MKKLNLLLIILILTVSCFSQPSILDKSFGNNGINIISNPNGDDYPFASTILKDDKILVLSSYASDENVTRTIFRYMPDGKPDNSFGNEGNIQLSVGGPPYYNCFTVHKDSKISFASVDLHGWITLTRIMADGTTDSSFGMNGIYTDNSLTSQRVDDIALQPDGKIIICGHYTFDPDQGIIYSLVSRFNEDGALDKSFGKSGHAVLDTSFFIPVSIAIQPDGKIICAGSNEGSCALVRYNTDGTLDKEFGQNGEVKTYFAKYSNYFKDVIIQPDGKIVAVGTAGDNADVDYPYIAVTRYNNDGSLDKKFGDAGTASVKVEGLAHSESVVLQQNNKIVVAGWTAASTSDFSLARFTDNGVLDTSFGENGLTVTDISSTGGDQAFDVGLQSDGRIILSGYSADDKNVNSVALAGYVGDPVKDEPPLAKKIKRWIKNHILNWQGLQNDDVAYYSIEQSSGIAGFKEIGRVKNVNRQSLNVKAGEQSVYSFNVSNASSSNIQNAATNTSYYRIRAVSNDGSNVVSDVISDESFSSINISPNPVKNVLRISGLPSNQKSTINIINRNGNVLQSAICNASVCNINVTQLRSGLYNVQIVSKGKTETVKFVKG